MGVTEILSMIGDYGTLVLLAGLSIYFAYRHFSNKVKVDAQRDNLCLEERKIELNTKQDLYNIIGEVLRDKTTRIADADEEAAQINIHIDGLLSKLLRDSDADRVLFFVYHNGGHDYNGRSLYKMSCVNEVVKSGLIPIQHEYQNLLRTFLITIYNELHKKDFLYVDDIETLKENDPSSYYYFTRRNARNFYIVAVKNIKDRTIGFISLSSSKPIEKLDEVKRHLCATALKIEGIYSVTEEEER